MRAMNQSDVLLLCKEFKCEKFSAGDYVIQKGEASNDKFYVIISGQVGILIPNDKSKFGKIGIQRKNKSLTCVTNKHEMSDQAAIRQAIWAIKKTDSLSGII